MAERPVFRALGSGAQLVQVHMIAFEWFPGMAVKQAQKSIASLHESARRALHIDQVLEISTKSPDQYGVALSAFNLTFCTTKHRREFSVESAFQSSKVFEYGGPYTDLMKSAPRDAKRDPRLKNSGKLKAFRFFRQDWYLEPKTAFYDWLYINALAQHEDLIDYVLDYSAFTDIAFNPERSINCQAYAAALFVALHKRNLLREALAGQESFIRVISDATENGLERRKVSQNEIQFD